MKKNLSNIFLIVICVLFASASSALTLSAGGSVVTTATPTEPDPITVQDPVPEADDEILSPSNICDVSCDLTIRFPFGGTLTAKQALTFTFGEGGVIELGETGTINASIQPALLTFVAGETLTLDLGESITFDGGGFIKTASGGNFEFSDLEVTTDVEFEIVIDDGNTLILFSNLSILGDGDFSFTANGDAEVIGIMAGSVSVTVTLLEDSNLVFSGENTYTGVTTVNAGTLSISTIRNFDTATLGATEINAATLVGFPNFVLDTSELFATLITDFSNYNIGDTYLIYTSYNSTVDFETENCIITTLTECVLENGNVYRYNQNGLLRLVDTGGAFSGWLVFVFSLLLIGLRKYGVLINSFAGNALAYTGLRYCK